MATAPVSARPLPSLTAAHLNDAARFFAANTAALELVFDLEGVFVHVTPRDLRFLHDLEPVRFGHYRECVLCQAERDAD